MELDYFQDIGTFYFFQRQDFKFIFKYGVADIAGCWQVDLFDGGGIGEQYCSFYQVF